MGYYSFAYVLAVAISALCWALVFQKYRNPFGWYFFVFSTLVSAWFSLYYLFFSGISDPALLLFLSRLNFWVGVGAVASFWLVVRNYSTSPSKIVVPGTAVPALAFAVILALYLIDPGIIETLEFSKAEGVYREVYGSRFWIHPLLQFSAVTAFVWEAFRQLKAQKGLDRIRLQRLLSAAWLFLAVCLILQLLLPMFGIWVFEKEIVFLFTAFTAYAFHALRRYYFHSGSIAGKYAVAIVSAGVAVLASEIFDRIGRAAEITSSVTDYWTGGDERSVVRALVAVLAYAGVSRLLRSKFFTNSELLALQEEMSALERRITGVSNPFDLNAVLAKYGTRPYRTELCEIRALTPEEAKNSKLARFFSGRTKEREFIKDPVFMAERRGSEATAAELPKNAFVAFPLRENGKMWGFLFMGKKSFSESYSSEEMSELRKFALFLELHVRYMETYGQLSELTLSLDRKVDEKTLEYNDLINRQKEFISMVSHEIKAPITNAVFQSDALLDDLESGLGKPEIKRGLDVLHSQLVRAGELISKLFSVQYYDTRSVTLFKEKVAVGLLLEDEADVLSSAYPNARFETRISDVGFAEIDRLQFQQAVSNLLQNALKHSGRANPRVVLGAETSDGALKVWIEDDGDGLADTESIFERYVTGEGTSASLGMGLYLCRKIVEMHGGTIRAEKSAELWGARFVMEIPSAD